MSRTFCPQCRKELLTSLTSCSCGWIVTNHQVQQYFDRMRQQAHRPDCDALRAELTRKDAKIKALEELVEAQRDHHEDQLTYHSENRQFGCASDYIQDELRKSSERVKAARARLVTVRGEGLPV